MKLVRSLAVVVTVTTLALVARTASSEEAAGALGPSVGSSGTSGTISLGTTAALLPLATTGAIVYFVVVKKDDKGGGTQPNTGGEDAGGGYVMNETEAEQWVEMYVRDHSEQLTSDIARGYGPTLADLSVMLRIKAEHRALFGAKLQANASELVPLTNKNTLTKKRAAQFFERMGDILRTDAALKRDLASVRI